MLQVDDVADAVAFVTSRPSRVTVDWIRLGPA
jgi:NADP-dependent 3-hydroxy acid dehydrogenase YdfG